MKTIELSFILELSDMWLWDPDGLSAHPTSQRLKHLPGHHREETTGQVQNKELAQGQYAVDKNLVWHISRTMRLTVHKCFFKNGGEGEGQR
jgi:hypothetical protein